MSSSRRPRSSRGLALWRVLPVVMLPIAWMNASACSDEPTDAAPVGDAKNGAELYAKYCASCHGKLGEGATAPKLVPWTRDTGLLVSLIDTTMPKQDPTLCTGQCAKDIAAFILSLETACDAPAYGPQKLRLLNRREYNATVNDLFSLTGPSGASCSTDADCDIEKASCTGGICVADPCNLQTFVLPAGGKQYASVHVAGEFNNWPGTVAAGGWKMVYAPQKDLYYTKRTLQNGTYQYKFVLDEATWIADPANPVKVPDGFGGQNSSLTKGCSAGGAASATYDWSKDFPVESRPKGFGFDDNADAGLVTSVHVEQYMKAAEALAQKGTENLAKIVPCDPAADPAGCAKTFVSSFGKRAFRRPLTANEVTKYAGFVTGQPTFAEGVRVALQVMLSSPNFLYRFEIGTPRGDGTFALDSWEMASLLSYSLWGTMPDDLLLAAAESGKLGTPDGVTAETRRLLMDGRAREMMGLFSLQWLGVERVMDADKSTSLYPSFGDAQRMAMAEETRTFVTHVVFDGTGKFDELFLGGYTFANDALASVYGLPGGLGSAMVQVDQPAERKAGLLGHGSVMASYSHSDQTSPIRRGLFVRQYLLCQEFGQPPANAGGVPDVDPNATTRERFKQHSSDPACHSCHQYIDDLGFGFEKFDAIGGYREMENGKPIDSAGDMNDVERLGSNTHAPYATLPELATILAESRSAKTCFATQYYRYATGRLESVTDVCGVRQLDETFEATGFDLKELVVGVMASDGMRIRK